MKSVTMSKNYGSHYDDIPHKIKQFTYSFLFLFDKPQRQMREINKLVDIESLFRA